jgi:hypothetical protein
VKLADVRPELSKAYEFIEAEAAAGGSHPGGRPFGGLSLEAFRAARQQLAAQGLVVLTPAGRWVPTAGGER